MSNLFQNTIDMERANGEKATPMTKKKREKVKRMAFSINDKRFD